MRAVVLHATPCVGPSNALPWRPECPEPINARASRKSRLNLADRFNATIAWSARAVLARSQASPARMCGCASTGSESRAPPPPDWHAKLQRGAEGLECVARCRPGVVRTGGPRCLPLPAGAHALHRVLRTRRHRVMAARRTGRCRDGGRLAQAPQQRVPQQEGVRPAHAPRHRLPAMRLPCVACLCNIRHLARSPRQGWVRLLPRMGLYRCANCGKSQLFFHPQNRSLTPTEPCADDFTRNAPLPAWKSLPTSP